MTWNMGNGIRGLAGLVLCAVLLGCGGNPRGSSDNRDAIRLLLCAECGAVEEAGGEVLQQRLAENKMGGHGPLGPRFGCSECGKITADLVVVDLSFEPFQCTECGEKCATHTGDVLHAAREGDARLSPQGQLQLRCPECDSFTCIQASAEEPKE